MESIAHIFTSFHKKSITKKKHSLTQRGKTTYKSSKKAEAYQKTKLANEPPINNSKPTDDRNITDQVLIGFPNHLFKIDEWQSANITNTPTHLIIYEHPIFYGHRNTPCKLNYNKIRLIYVRAAVLAYIDYLNGQISTQKTAGLQSVSFISVDDHLKDNQSLSKIIAKLDTKKTTAIKYWDPVDVELSLDIVTRLIGNKGNIHSITKLDSPLFLTTDADLAVYHDKHATGRFTHSAFYDWQKTRSVHKEFKFPGHSYDTENRGQMPTNTTIPPLPKLAQPDIKYLQQAEKYISGHQEWGSKSRPGTGNQLSNIVFPVSHKATQEWFHNFLAKKLSHFGKYQDSIDGQARNYLFHSCISPMMNLGLITPLEVITAAHKYYQANSSTVGVANYEGFIRQIIGWREYQRYIYLYAGDKMRKSNYFHNQARLTPKWYTGELGVRPVDDAIKMAFRDGYLHHILRLMVMGNFMNLAGLHPDEVYRWFMEFALDSYDWVMVGNVYSMALWADGGLSMRKPYISSDTYIMTLGTYDKDTRHTNESSNGSSNESSTDSLSRSASRSSGLSNSESQSQEMGWNRKWYVLFYDFINRSQTQLKTTYYAGLVKAWNNKSQSERKQILNDVKMIKKQITN